MRALIAIPIVIAILLLILFLPVFIAAFNVIISIKEAMAITRIRFFI